MSDVHTKEVRSYNMSCIKNKNTKPELLVRKFLFSHGFRYRINVNNLPGHPDIVLKKYKTLIFINGCFWHGHENCRYFMLPKSNTTFWENKILNNKLRDRKNYQLLYDLGWNVIIIWECELKNYNKNYTLNSLLDELRKRSV